MTDFEIKMCEHQADYFELSLTRFSCSSSIFISTYMNSGITKELDVVDDVYNYISPNNLMNAFAMKYPKLSEEGSIKYPTSVLRWIGYIYRAFSIITKKYSSEIYKELKADKMLEYYNVFHTFDPDYCVERLLELINQNKESFDDYEIYKKAFKEFEYIRDNRT